MTVGAGELAALQAALEANKPSATNLNAQFGAVDSSMKPAQTNVDALRRELSSVVAQHGQQAADQYREYAARALEDRNNMLGTNASLMSSRSRGRFGVEGQAAALSGADQIAQRSVNDLNASGDLLGVLNQQRINSSDRYLGEVGAAIPITAARMKDKLTAGFVDQANKWNQDAIVQAGKMADAADPANLSDSAKKTKALTAGALAQSQAIEDVKAQILAERDPFKRERLVTTLAQAQARTDNDYARDAANTEFGAGVGQALFAQDAGEVKQRKDREDLAGVTVATGQALGDSKRTSNKLDAAAMGSVTGSKDQAKGRAAIVAQTRAVSLANIELQKTSRDATGLRGHFQVNTATTNLRRENEKLDRLVQQYAVKPNADAKAQHSTTHDASKNVTSLAKSAGVFRPTGRTTAELRSGETSSTPAFAKHLEDAQNFIDLNTVKAIGGGDTGKPLVTPARLPSKAAVRQYLLAQPVQDQPTQAELDEILSRLL